MSNLILHVGAKSVTREQVAAAPTPPRTKTWVPVPHGRLLDGIQGTLELAGLKVASVVPLTRLPAVLAEWREPRHPEFRDGKTAWRLFNAFTEGLKGNLDALPRRTQALHGLMDAACGLVLAV